MYVCIIFMSKERNIFYTVTVHKDRLVPFSNYRCKYVFIVGHHINYSTYYSTLYIYVSLL